MEALMPQDHVQKTRSHVYVDYLLGEKGCSLQETVPLQDGYYYSILEARDFAVNPTHFILFIEHPSVYSVSKHRRKNSGLFRKPKHTLPAPLLEIPKRGGSITYHGPGQLVCYMIFDSKSAGVAFSNMASIIKRVGVELLSLYGIKAHNKPAGLPEAADGVWTTAADGSARKILSYGLYLSRDICRSGFMINVSPDLAFFDYINPCGCPQITMTSMAELLGREVDITTVSHELAPLLINALFNSKRASYE